MPDDLLTPPRDTWVPPAADGSHPARATEGETSEGGPSRWAFLNRPGQFSRGLALGIVMLLVGGTGIAGFRLGTDTSARGLPPEFANVERLFDLVGDDAVTPTGDDALVVGAITGLLETLDDEYAVYYDPSRYAALTADLDGEFTGIGVTIEERNDGVYIVGVLPGTPAERVGVDVGERITAVDGVSALNGPTTADVIAMIAGDAGTDVTISFDGGDQGPRDVTITREVLDLPQVASRVLDSGYGYASVRQFSRQVESQLRDQVQGMINDDDISGLVLDLRGNPGGLLTQAIEVTSLFVEEGVVVRIDSRDSSIERTALGDAPFSDLPLVVLVDEGSASASEIVAGALQDLDRAEIVGSQTFGKGTVQTIRDLGLGAGVKFTTAAYFTPSGDSIDGVGVTPDTEAAGDPEEQLAAAETVLADLIAEGPGS